MFQKVLVAVDGSAASIKAVGIARQMINEGSAKEVALLHVVVNHNEVMLVNGMYMPLDYPQLYNELNEAAKKVLDSAKATLGPDIPADLLLETGPPAEIICKIAEKENFDLILIGNRGLNRLQRLLLGSISSKVTALAHCSVLVVK
jgi:nucleotide-binding universal stress UspA family protein